MQSTESVVRIHGTNAGAWTPPALVRVHSDTFGQCSHSCLLSHRIYRPLG
jgi:hypothetical protein